MTGLVTRPRRALSSIAFCITLRSSASRAGVGDCMTASCDDGRPHQRMLTIRTRPDEHARVNSDASAETDWTRDCRPSRQGHAARDPTPRFRSAAGPHPAPLCGP